MAKTKDGGPAFPRPASEWTASGTLADGNQAIVDQCGMTLRDWFAGQIAASMFNGLVTDAARSQDVQFICAREAYAMADALIKARE